MQIEDVTIFLLKISKSYEKDYQKKLDHPSFQIPYTDELQ